MYLMLVAVLAVVGGWAGWRRNPLFSARRTLRFVVVFACMITVLIYIISRAAAYAVHTTEAKGLTLMFSVVFVMTMFMIWAIMAMSTPKSTPLPPSVKRVHVYRNRLGRWAKRLAIAVVVLGVLALVLPMTGKIIVASLGGLLVFTGAICLFGGYLAARQNDLWLSAVEAEPWVHWTYSEEQWKRWMDTEVARTAAVPPGFLWRRDWKKVVPIAAVMVAVPLVIADGWTEKLLLSALILAMLMGGVLLAKDGQAGAATALGKKLMKAPREVYIGQEGVFADGDFTPWLTVSDFLLSASIDERVPRSLNLLFEKVVPGAAGNDVIHVNQAILLPEGDVAGDLARLQKEISARCSTATVRVG
jgi:hypothetical protein